MNKLFDKLWIVILFCLIATDVFGLRVSKPLTLTYPITAEQISQLNKYLEEIWLIQNGRFELDVTSSKTSAKNGEIWVNSSNNKLEWKSNGTVYSTP